MSDDQRNRRSPPGEALAHLLAYRGRFPTGSTVDPESRLTTADLDAAIDALRKV